MVKAKNYEEITQEAFEILRLCDGNHSYKVIAGRLKMDMDRVRRLIVKFYTEKLIEIYKPESNLGSIFG